MSHNIDQKNSLHIEMQYRNDERKKNEIKRKKLEQKHLTIKRSFQSVPTQEFSVAHNVSGNVSTIQRYYF